MDWRQVPGTTWTKVHSEVGILMNLELKSLFSTPAAPWKICAWCGNKTRQWRVADGSYRQHVCKDMNCRTLSSMMNREEWLATPVSVEPSPYT